MSKQTTEITFGFACRDDCLDRMVPSDLRQVVAERDSLRKQLAEAQASQWVKCEAGSYPRNRLAWMLSEEHGLVVAIVDDSLAVNTMTGVEYDLDDFQWWQELEEPTPPTEGD